MSAPPLSLREQREALRRRCAVQREQLSHALGAVQWRLRGIDRGISAVRRIRLIPALLTLIPMVLTAVPALCRAGRALTIVNSLRWLLPRRGKVSLIGHPSVKAPRH